MAPLKSSESEKIYQIPGLTRRLGSEKRKLVIRRGARIRKFCLVAVQKAGISLGRGSRRGLRRAMTVSPSRSDGQP